MSEYVELCWLNDEISLKEVLKDVLGSSGQLLKKYLSSKEQNKSLKARQISKLPLNLVNHLRINPNYIGPEIEVLSENENFLALHKPNRIHCHPHSYEDKNTLLNYLLEKEIWLPIQINLQNYDRGLLYRLDFETSGVIVLAKNEKFLKSIRSNFELEMKRKFYWAIVEGDFDKEGNWTHYFKSSGEKGIKQKVSNTKSDSSFEGTLSVAKLMTESGKSLLLINLKTGLRHQIRAQLAHLGYPILGDELYGAKKNERLFLHAFRYEFTDVVEDNHPELFHLFFDLNSALKMSHDMLRRF